MANSNRDNVKDAVTRVLKEYSVKNGVHLKQGKTSFVYVDADIAASIADAIFDTLKLPLYVQDVEPDDTIEIRWSVEDVLDQAEQLKIKLSKKEAQNILQDIHRRHDASIGVSWDTITYYIENCATERKIPRRKTSHV